MGGKRSVDASESSGLTDILEIAASIDREKGALEYGSGTGSFGGFSSGSHGAMGAVSLASATVPDFAEIDRSSRRPASPSHGPSNRPSASATGLGRGVLYGTAGGLAVAVIGLGLFLASSGSRSAPSDLHASAPVEAPTETHRGEFLNQAEPKPSHPLETRTASIVRPPAPQARPEAAPTEAPTEATVSDAAVSDAGRTASPSRSSSATAAGRKPEPEALPGGKRSSLVVPNFEAHQPAKPAPQPDAEAPAEPPKAAATEVSDAKKFSTDCLLEPDRPDCGPAKPAAPVTPAPAPREDAGLPEKLTQTQMRAALEPRKQAAKACGTRHGAAGEMVRVKLSIQGSSGKVTQAVPLAPHSADAVGSCVAAALQGATFPRFADEAQGLIFPVRL